MSKKINFKNVEEYFDCNLSIKFRALADKNLRGNRLKVYIIISNFKHVKGYCFATNEYIAKICNCSVRQVAREIRALKTLKYIVCAYRIKNNKTDRKIFDNYDIKRFNDFLDENKDYEIEK